MTLFLFSYFLMAHNVKRECSGSVVECLTWDRGAAGWSLTGVIGLCPWARNIYPSLVLVQPRKTHPCLTERLLIGRKESIKTKHNVKFLRGHVSLMLINVNLLYVNSKGSEQPGLPCSAFVFHFMECIITRLSYMQSFTWFTQAWKLFEFRELSWKVLEN